jgi:hypothetical protein
MCNKKGPILKDSTVEINSTLPVFLVVVTAVWVVFIVSMSSKGMIGTMKNIIVLTYETKHMKYFIQPYLKLVNIFRANYHFIF